MNDEQTGAGKYCDTVSSKGTVNVRKLFLSWNSPRFRWKRTSLIFKSVTLSRGKNKH